VVWMAIVDKNGNETGLVTGVKPWVIMDECIQNITEVYLKDIGRIPHEEEVRQIFEYMLRDAKVLRLEWTIEELESLCKSTPTPPSMP